MKKILNLLKFVAISGNIIYFFWILYNGIDDGFKGTIITLFSFTGILLLLILNIFLLSKKF